MPQSTVFADKEEFLIYTSLYAAYVDFNLSDEEIQWMNKRFGKSNVDRISKKFLVQSEFTNLNTIQENKDKFFPGPQGTIDLLNFMKELFTVDGDFSLLEQISFSFLSRYLENGLQ